MSASLQGRVAIVTGASRGIGAATARALAGAGAAVALAARDEAALALASEIRGAGGMALAVPTDVTDPDAVQRLVARTVGELGGLHLAFNNAGGSHRPAPLHELTVEDFDRALASNLRGTFLCLKREIPAMLAGGGAIVNMASTAGLHGVGTLAGYVSAKHGGIGLTKVAALDYADDGIRVNAVAPGPILTENLQHAGDEAQRSTGAADPEARHTGGGRCDGGVTVHRPRVLHHRGRRADRRGQARGDRAVRWRAQVVDQCSSVTLPPVISTSRACGSSPTQSV